MENLTERQKHELDKYLNVYKQGTTSTPGIYGHKNWGSGVYDYIKKIKPNSILDVGCGKGVFVNDMVSKLNIPIVYGADIASVSTNNHIKNDKIIWLDCMAHNLDVGDNMVEYVVSFDCLEHCLEEDVDLIVDEFYRVAEKGLILRITYRQANERTLNGEVLHMTVKPESWWLDKFSKKFKFDGKFNKDYLLFSK